MLKATVNISCGGEGEYDLHTVYDLHKVEGTPPL